MVHSNFYSLFLVTMNGKSGPAILTQVLCNIVGHSLGGNKDEHLGVLSADLVKVLDELIPLLKVAANFNDLLDVRIGCQFHGANVHLNEVLEEILQ